MTGRIRIVVPSANADNLVESIGALLRAHPGLDSSRVVVVDDGARTRAEARLPKVMWVAGHKPFVFSKNVNAGILAFQDWDHIVIMGDDVQFLTLGGLDLMLNLMEEKPKVGILSASVRGIVGNPMQAHHSSNPAFRYETKVLCFICVMVRREAWEAIGPLDESFSGYGYDDNDYSLRCLDAGFDLGIDNRCVVAHDTLQSTYRSRPDFNEIFEINRRLFFEKWKGRCS